jgi:mannose-6-phosphate isomerase-like protein (cupin superfamily)
MAYKEKLLQNSKAGQDILFLKTAKDTNGMLLEMEACWRPGSMEPPLHYHPLQTEEFLVLAGELTVRINGRINILKEGEFLRIPPGKRHAMWNNSEFKTMVNWKVRPALTTEYLLETGIGLANDGKVKENGMPHLLQVALIANKYSNVFRLARPPYIIQRILFAILSPIAWLLGYKSMYKEYID